MEVGSDDIDFFIVMNWYLVRVSGRIDSDVAMCFVHLSTYSATSVLATIIMYIE